MSSQYDLYTWVTPNGWKASILLEELGVDYTVHPLDLSRKDQKQPAFLAINPNGRIPALVDRAEGDFAVFESGAILMYLAEQHRQFLPQDPKGRSQVVQWLMFQMGGLGPIQGQTHAFIQFMEEKNKAAIDRFQAESMRLYTVMDTVLADRDHLAGAYSIADMAVLPWVRLTAWAGLTLSDFPNLQRWFKRLMARPAVRKGLDVPHHTEFWDHPKETGFQLRR